MSKFYRFLHKNAKKLIWNFESNQIKQVKPNIFFAFEIPIFREITVFLQAHKRSVYTTSFNALVSKHEFKTDFLKILFICTQHHTKCFLSYTNFGDFFSGKSNPKHKFRLFIIYAKSCSW